MPDITLKDWSLNDIDIPASVLNQAKNYLLQNNITKQSLSTYIKDSFHPVQTLAYNYLQNLTQYVNKIQQIMRQRLLVEKARVRVKEAGSGYEFVYNQKKFKTLGNQLSKQTINIVSQTELFSENLQEVLGMKPILAYTHMTKGHETDIYIIDDISKITKIQSKSKNIYNPRLRATLNGLKQYGEKVNKLQYMSQLQLKYLDNAYLTSLQRFNKYIYKHTPSHLILYNMGTQSKPHWYGMWMQQRGDLVESYQKAIFSRYQVFTGSQGVPQIDIDKFLNLVTQVDSASGLLQGDTQVNGLSISSKMRGAQPQGINQAIKLAVELINLMDNSESNIIDYLNTKKDQLAEKGGVRNSIIEISKEQFNKIMASQISK